MTENPFLQPRFRVVDPLTRRGSRLDRTRVTLDDGARTTLHVASYDLSLFAPRVVALDPAVPLARWCSEKKVRDAVVGGFFLRPAYTPLGELRVDGALRSSVPFDPPWHAVRACLQVSAGAPRIARRDQLEAEPDGDLLQAGPLLVRDGRRALAEDDDAEGFSAGARQFDSDITRGRYPRAAMAIDEDRMLAVACDGRTYRDAGMTLVELADTLVGLGATDALNLDGGGSASLIYRGRMRNRPREEHGIDLLEGRRVATAVAFEAR